MTTLFSSPDQLTPTTLTALLHDGGHLTHGKVLSVRVTRACERLVSHTYFLELAYAPEAVPQLPHTMLFKVTKPHLLMRGKEATFYQHAVDRGRHVPVPRCFSAVYCPETHREHLLLEDLSATHNEGSVWPTPPTLEHMRLLVDALAQQHAGWWGDTWLLESYAHTLEWETIQQSYAEDDDWLARMLRALKDTLPREQADLFLRVYERFPRVYWQRLHAHRHLTMPHGDAHAWNFLYPNDPTGHVYLIDWQCWELGLAGRDTAYLIALRWEPDLRRRHERDLLQRYYDALLANGVTDYTWDDCWYDYRLMCLYNMYFPACFYHKKFGERGMWQMIEHSIQTVLAHDCIELVD